MLRLFLSLLLAMSFAVAVAEEDGENWLRLLPAELATLTKKPITNELVFEVVASKAIMAISDLSSSEFMPLEGSTASYLTGSYFHCPESYQPYLLRAVYGYGTGVYRLSQIGTTILVEHGSLGGFLTYNKSALVVCLNFQPTRIFNRVNIAK